MDEAFYNSAAKLVDELLHWFFIRLFHLSCLVDDVRVHQLRGAIVEGGVHRDLAAKISRLSIAP